MSDTPRRDEAPRPDPAQGAAPPNPAPAPKDEVATDVSEVSRQRLAGTDKTQTAGSIAEDAVDAAPGVAGTPADDDTAAEVEAAPSATAPNAASTDGGSKTAPAETQPAGTGAPTRPPAQAAAPAAPAAPAAGAGAAPTSGPAPADRPADPDNSATAPTAPDAAPTAAAAAAATGEAEKKPEAPATPTAPKPAAAPAAAAADGAAKPAPAARPAGAAGAAGARPAGAAGARPAGAAGAKPAAPAAPPKPPEPDPEEVTELRSLVPDLTWERRHGYLEVKVPKEQLIPVARKVKGLGYDYLSAVTAVDWRDRVEMLYHCYGWDYVETPGCVVIRADLPPEPNPLCPSLTTVWAGAELQEREIYDLFGVKFVGHPDLRRILLEDRFPGHPLRKDWTFDYEYVLVKHLKYGAEGQDAPPGGEEGFRRV